MERRSFPKSDKATVADVDQPAQQSLDASPTPPVRAPKIDGSPAAATTSCDVARIRSCYGPMRTVAGLGTIGRRGENGWKPEYEGGAATAAELSRPHFAMADAAGNIYIADKDANAIRRVDVKGKITTVAGTGVAGDDGDGPGVATSMRLSRPNGVFVKGDGTVYILDLNNGKVRRLATNGKMTTLFKVDGGISIGRGLWVSDDENHAFVASGRQIVEWKSGAKTRRFARGFRSLGNLTIDPNGKLVAADRVGGRVYRLDKKGAKTVIAGNGQSSGGGDGQPALNSSLPGVRAVWFDKRGGMFLGAHASSRVWYVGADGLLQEFLSDSEVDEVRGLSIDTAGNLIVVDDDSGFVRVLSVKLGK